MPIGEAAAQVIDVRWRVFLRVVDAGSLSRAAALLAMPQSMVSRAVTQLEQQCGERLFVRTGRGVVLTELGAQLLPSVARLVADSDAFLQEIQAARGQPMGDVRVGLLASTVTRHAGQLAALVGQRMPGVRLHLTEGASSQLEEHLREGRLDMAVVLREEEDAVGDAQLLARVPLHLIGPRGHPALAAGPVPLAALAGLPLILPPRPHLMRARLDRLAAVHGLKFQVAVEADSVRLQHEVAAMGVGLAIASIAASEPDTRLAWVPIVAPVLERFVVLAQSPRRPHTRATREVLRLLGDLARQQGQTG